MTSQHVGEVYYIHHRETHDWYWYSQQTPDDVTMFISYDSHQGIGPACECSLKLKIVKSVCSARVC